MNSVEVLRTINGTLLRSMGSLICGRGRRARLSILIYHRVLREPDPMLPDEICARTFEIHMNAVATNFNVLPLSEAVERLRHDNLPPRPLSITFDDGYANNHDVALPILAEYGLHACFFIATGFLDGSCMWNDAVIESLRSTRKERLDLSTVGLGDYEISSIESRRLALSALLARLKAMPLGRRQTCVAYIQDVCGTKAPEGLMMQPVHINSLVEAGMEIGAHTVNHPILASIPNGDAAAEISKGKAELERIVGCPIRLFAYPNGRPGIDFRSRHVEMVKELGFSAAVTTATGAATRASNRFLLPRFTPWDRTTSRFTLRLYKIAFETRRARQRSIA